jgi:hypothetical protein
MVKFELIEPENKNHIWSLQRVVPTDIGTWTASEEPFLIFHLNSVESAGSTEAHRLGYEVFQINFKSGKTIWVEVPKEKKKTLLEELIWCIGKTK